MTLVQYLKLMEAKLFGFSTKELQMLTFQLAERNKIPHPFNRIDEMAVVDWLEGFMKRHADLSLRKPEPTSAARALGFNKVAASKFFDLLERLVDKHKLTPNQIFNCDETGVTTMSKSYQKLIALKGRRQVGTLTSAEKGNWLQ
ncbi:PREDICTED: uncharacterized protein LOC106806035 [Priapulus caudatus]|uniref:Uncharacterized protein LOC106806035 n=1 Tax=Priapulus caudatus TaxID=37621 RepID=A0ABM1DTU3_PRICU|nr:PREDICTED: uncharacterized protein LOC106806035 [Priapulus caudatus]